MKRKIPALMAALLMLVSCGKTGSGNRTMGEFTTDPLTADELAFLVGWSVLKICDGPEQLHHFYGYRMFIRKADGKQYWLNGHGWKVGDPPFDVRKTPVIVAFKQDGTTLQYRVAHQVGVSNKFENFFSKESCATEGMPQREGNLVSLYRTMERTGPGPGPTKGNSVYIEFFTSPPTEAEIMGTPQLTKKD